MTPPTASTAPTAVLVQDDPLTAATAAAPRPRPQRVLLAAGDALALSALAERVSAPGREVHTTVCGQVALDLALQLHFDLVVLRDDLPGVSAAEVTRRLRATDELAQPSVVLLDGTGEPAAALVHPAALERG
ncbi:hypothetical protein [Kineococcus sp. SYSU DK006]|uniref:hypothetical protein n=1 Tax=Kineococcus sp. SYSU DK006 TaxID=3383127 RepID=UPI003D7CAB9B